MSNLNIKQTEWDLSSLLKSEDESLINAEVQQIIKETEEFVNKWKNRTDYLEDAVVLKEALDEFEKVSEICGGMGLGNVGYYFWLRSMQNQDDANIKAWNNKLSEIATRLCNDLEFFTNRLSKISLDKQGTFLKSDHLTKYRHYLKRMFENAKYVLSEPEEKILALKQQTSCENWIKMVSDLLSREQHKVLTEGGKKELKPFSEIRGLLIDSSKVIRDDAAKIYTKIIAKHSDIAEAEMNSILADEKVDHELRGIKRPDGARHIVDDIEAEIIDALLDVIVSNYDLPHRYFELKAKLMKVKKLKYYERFAEFGSFNKKYSFKEAVEIVNKVFLSLDPEFSSIFLEFLNNGKFDVYPRKGKCGGAFCVGSTKFQPVYILLNHTDKLADVTTLAHETGHAINDEHIKKAQPNTYFGTSKGSAEVASTFFEDFVYEELFKDANDELRLFAVIQKIEDALGSIFIQCAGYKLEQELHKTFREKGYLSKKEIAAMYMKNMTACTGDFVEQTKGFEYGWIAWPHLRDFFYVYSYASGLLISKSLQSYVKKDPTFIKKVKTFMSAGTSKSVKDIFLDIGIDISDKTFWQKGIDEVRKQLDEAERLAKKLNKI